MPLVSRREEQTLNRLEDTRLLLVRHALTDWNDQGRFQGRSDTPLNQQGRESIPAVIEGLRPWKPASIVTSDLARAHAMAEAAGRALAIRVVTDPRLRECDYGKWEGLTLEEIRERYPDELERWRQNEAEGARGGGESLREMAERSWGALVEIAGRNRGRATAIITHSGPIRAAVCRIFDLSMGERYRFQIDNGSLTIVRRRGNGRWQLVLLNQTLPVSTPGSESPVASRSLPE